MKVDFNNVEKAFIDNKEITKIYHLDKMLFGENKKGGSLTNLIVADSLIAGYIDYGDGQVADFPYIVTDFIPVEKGKRYYGQTFGMDVNFEIYLYDDNKQYIGFPQGQIRDVFYEATNSNVKYIRFYFETMYSNYENGNIDVQVATKTTSEFTGYKTKKNNLIKTSTMGKIDSVGWISKGEGAYFVGTEISIDDKKTYLPKKDGNSTTVVISEMYNDYTIFRNRRVTGNYKPTSGTIYIDILFTELSESKDYTLEEL